MLAMSLHKRPLDGETAIIRISLDEGVSHTAVPLIVRLADAGARVVVVAGLGNPAGDINPAFSLEKFRPLLEDLTGKPVSFVKESVGIGAEAGLARVPHGEIALMENLRFHADERRREKVFAMRLSVLGDYFIDAGDPPINPEGWQAALKTMLPEPDLDPTATMTREEA